MSSSTEVMGTYNILGAIKYSDGKTANNKVDDIMAGQGGSFTLSSDNLKDLPHVGRYSRVIVH